MLVSQNTGLSYHVRCEEDLVVWVISAFISTQHARKIFNLKAPFQRLLFGHDFHMPKYLHFAHCAIHYWFQLLDRSLVSQAHCLQFA